jgi:hypothetical protein
MKAISEIKQNNRLSIIKEGEDGFAAYIIRPYNIGQFGIIASWGMGWEHVSASMTNRCPTWEEMCLIKDIFWSDDECVIQYHPPKNEYVKLHPYCLHLWKKIGSDFETPPKKLVG